MKELMQLLLNAAVEKRVFGPFAEFKKINPITISKMKERLEDDPTVKAIKESGVDPAELKKMFEIAFDSAVKKLRENLLKALDAAIGLA